MLSTEALTSDVKMVRDMLNNPHSHDRTDDVVLLLVHACCSDDGGGSAPEQPEDDGQEAQHQRYAQVENGPLDGQGQTAVALCLSMLLAQ